MKLKPGWLFGLAVVLSVLGIAGLRINQQQAVAMQNDVIGHYNAADGEVTGEVEAAAAQLGDFVRSRMNASVRFELRNEQAYREAVAAYQSAQMPQDSGALYAQAQAECDREGISSTQQAACVQAFLEARLDPGENPEPLVQPNPADYTRVVAFSSPTWAPDLPGISLAAAALLAFSSVTIYWVRFFRGQLD